MKAHKNMECRYLPGELCKDCYAHELNDYRSFSALHPSLQGETELSYWKRINGSFGDAWFHAAHEAIK